jgi:hypothetical protein
MSRTIGRGWATVDTDRAARELAGLLRMGVAFEPVPRSAVLGARCVRGLAASTTSWIVLLEPNTEGRAAGFLARHGEGWAATWLAEDADPADDTDPADPGESPVRSEGSPGPLGQETLEAGGPRWGPYRLLVTAATIEP